MPSSFAFYTDPSGQMPPLDFLFSLSEKERDKCFQYLLLLCDNEGRLPAQYAKHVEGKIWELRPEFGGVEMRMFYYTMVGSLIVVLHGFKKKDQKTPTREIATARRRMEELEG